MRTLTTSFLFFLAILLFVGLGETSVLAQKFEALATSSKGTTSKEMAAFFEFQMSNCASRSNSFERRQCEVLQKFRHASTTKASYVLDAGANAIAVIVNEKLLSVEVRLHSCVRCGSEDVLILGKGPHKSGPNGVTGAVVATVKKNFKKLEEAQRWAKHAIRLKGQLIVKVPVTADRFNDSGRTGHKVKVIGYRLYDPCQGEVLVSKPISAKGPVSEESCDTEPEVKLKVNPVETKKIVARLSPAQIKTTMNLAARELQKCHRAYNIDGKLVLKLVITADGKLTKVEHQGDFVGTPTGICIDETMALVNFPLSKKKTTKVTYPMTLR